MPIDQSIINLVKNELDAGKKAEDIVSKLRTLDYTDDQIEEIFVKSGTGIKSTGLTIIKRPSRTTIFKTIFSPTVLLVVFVLVVAVGGIYYLTTTLNTESMEEKAKNIADSTSDSSLFLKAMELQNAIIKCIPAYDTEDTGFGFCDVATSKKLEDLGGGKFKVIYSIDENSMCPKNYIKKNDMLEIEVDLVSGSTSSKWISNPTLKEDTINSLYPKKGNCKYLAGYVYQFIEQLKIS